MDDISAIVEAENLNQFFLFGLSEGAAISLVYAATHTDKVKSVAVFGGTAKFTKADDYKFVPEYEVMVENMLSSLITYSLPLPHTQVQIYSRLL